LSGRPQLQDSLISTPRVVPRWDALPALTLFPERQDEKVT